ncbi:MAG: SulP family inorganic anion transporter [Pirellulaceae bacterium]|nr:SulP family inorganic anion transporter [Pirellulaceae bacterium]
MQKSNQTFLAELAKNLVAGLAVSFVAISLGAAFGILSTRGAFAGILSAGIIALITGLFGGTRIQTSGPTAPMTAVTVLLVAFATSTGQHGLLQTFPGADPAQFINLVLVLCGGILLIAAVCRLGRFIQFVPRVVISGFMSGIAILIWLDQTKKLFGIGGQERFAGSLAVNISVALAALAIAFAVPIVANRFFRRWRAFVPPGTLVAIAAVTIVVQLMAVDIQMVKTENVENSVAAWAAVVQKNMPTDWTPQLVWFALPFAFQLAMLCYLDTLLTSLVMDKRMTEQFGREERTKQNQELAAQGAANAAVALVGGIPGAQATIRSVLILNEGATWRLAGAAVGVFVLIEMLIFQDYISTIPVAVFTGILFKVGYDVFDWEPCLIYGKGLLGSRDPLGLIDVGHREMFFIAGTAAVTLVQDLNTAVIVFTVLFYVVRLKFTVPDLEPVETAAVKQED